MKSNEQVFQKVPAVIDQVCAEGLMATNRFVPVPPWESLLQGEWESDAWLLVEVEAGAPVGWCRLFSTGIPGEWELGIGLLSSYRNRGRGSRMIRQALRWARHRGAQRVILFTRCDNQRAIHVFEKCGFLPMDCEQGWLEMICSLSAGEALCQTGTMPQAGISIH